MRNLLTAVLLLCSTTSFSQENNYQKAWDALNNNDRDQAAHYLDLARKDPATAQDAYVSYLYLQSYNGKEDEVTDFVPSFYETSNDPFPYVFALWFNQGVAGPYGRKTADCQLKLIDKVLSDAKAPGSLVAAANYQMEMNLIFSGDFEKADTYAARIGNIRDWQFTGPFENLSESGFYKDYGPLAHPEPTAVFTSLSNAEVKWFTPASENPDGWIPVIYQFNKRTAVVYAQNFVNAPEDQDVLCSVGCAGAIKVWINDQLVISDSKSHTTELDNYTVACHLSKGTNRVLVQLGYTNATYPNFSLRFTDPSHKPVTGIKGSPVYAPYPRKNSLQAPIKLIPQFAEKYFSDKILSEPDNLVNYLLLADTYLRSEKLLEARDLMSQALKKAPKNSLLRVELVQILNKQDNRTSYLEELEKIKQADPQSVLVMDLNIKEMYDNEKYEDCAAALDERIKLHGENETTYGYRIMLLIQDKKYDDLVKVVEKMYAKYPSNTKLLPMMYNLKKEVYKDKKGAMKVYENYMKNNYDYDSYIKYADLLIEEGNTKKGLGVKEKLTRVFPYDPSGLYNLSRYYFTVKDYQKAEDYVRKSLALSPYNESYWELLGDVKNEKKDVDGALKAYDRSLQYDPNQYEIISKIRKMKDKPDVYKLFPAADVDQVISQDRLEDAKNTTYGYYYILDQKDVVLYPDGANEEYSTLIIRITNDKGIERFKESTIGYNSNQTLLIEKAEIIKKNHAKIEGERNDNEIVFTNLEAGDVIVFKYRLQRYAYGRFASDFWDKYYFGGQIYSAITKYNLYAPEGKKINYIFNNSPVQPVIKKTGDFTQYSWVVTHPTPLGDEPLMPLVADVGTVLHISTIPSWKEIANWYSDVSNNESEKDFEIISLFHKLFPESSKGMTQFEKARKIYDYIEANIRYSSVSFRQSAYVPQRASATLTTRLGDCKDLSNLFVTLAHMAGIPAQMVLVDTRDNGQKDILLPSIEFNHCIAKASLDGHSYYIELTDNYLPFTSLPNDLNGALILEIPLKPGKEEAALIHLHSNTRTRDVIKRMIDIHPVNDDLTQEVKTLKYGSFSSSVRETYRNLDSEKRQQKMEESIAGSYKNNVRLEKVSFKDLDQLSDSIEYSYRFTVKNEVAEIGSLNTFKIIYPDIVATLDNFSSEKREYPIEYWRYENADAYETTVTITAPAGKKFVELPKNETLSFKDMKYSIKYTLKAPDKLVVMRKFSNARAQQVAPADYTEFKTFFEKIVKAEQKFIAYK